MYFSALNLICLGISLSTARNLHNHDLSDDCKPSTKLCQWENQKRKNRKPKTKKHTFFHRIYLISTGQLRFYFVFLFVFFPKRFQKLNKIRRLFPFCVGSCLSPSNIKPSKNCRSWIWRSFLGKNQLSVETKHFVIFSVLCRNFPKKKTFRS